MNKNRIFAIILAFIAVLMTVFIFGNSLKVAEESKQQSAGIVEAVVEAANEIGVRLDAESVSFFIRKSAHFCEYFILSAIISAALALAFTNRRLIFISPLYCLLVAVCDEFVFQNATAGRSPEVRDCVIDLCGALLAVIAVYFVLFIIKKRKQQG